MPKEFDSIGATMLQVKITAQITTAAVQEAVLAEHACQQNTGSSCNQAQKLSNVKQKGTNPKWQPKNNNKQKGNQKQSSNKDNGDSKKRTHGNHSGQQAKEKQQVKEITSDAKHHHSHLASTVNLPWAFTTMNGHGTIIEPSLATIVEVSPTKDPCLTLPSSAYTGQQVGPSFYQSDNDARDLLSCMGFVRVGVGVLRTSHEQIQCCSILMYSRLQYKT